MKQRLDILGCVYAKMLRRQYRPVFGSIELIYVYRKNLSDALFWAHLKGEFRQRSNQNLDDFSL